MASTDSAPFQERYLTSQDNLRLYYRDYGPPTSHAPTILCLTGLTRNSKDFHSIASRLSATRRVLCPDYRGRGNSQYDTDPRRYVPPTYLNDIRHLLAATNTHRVVILGTSLGGLLAVGLAVVVPTAVAGVLMNDVGPDVNPEGLDRIVAYIGTDRPQPDWPTAAAHLREMLPRLGLDSEEDWMRLARGTFREGDDGILRFDWDLNLAKPFRDAAGPGLDLWALFRALRDVPTAVLRGENSDVLSEGTLARMQQALPGIIAVTVPNRGHTPTLEEPESEAAIDAVLSRV